MVKTSPSALSSSPKHLLVTIHGQDFDDGRSFIVSRRVSMFSRRARDRRMWHDEKRMKGNGEEKQEEDVLL